ncbi:MAG: hypothetical protein AAB965_00190, partial [Patescibacteria group bacterium]
MEYRGTVLCGPKKGKTFTGRILYCECDFREGVGWKIDPKHGPVSLLGPERCNRRKHIVRVRHEELHREYLNRFQYGLYPFP